MDKLWNENGEAIMGNDGYIHSLQSNEGRKVFKRNYENVINYGTIYDPDGGFYLD